MTRRELPVGRRGRRRTRLGDVDFEFQEVVLDELENLAERASASPALTEMRFTFEFPVEADLRHVTVDVVIGHASQTVTVVGVAKLGFPGDL